MSSATLFVGNLSWDVRDDDLINVFSKHGNVVKAEVQMLRSGRSKGWALVTMGSPAEATNAAEALHDYELEGRLMNVRMDRGPREAPAGGAPREPRQRRPLEPTNNNDGTKLFIGNLPWSITDDELAAKLQPYGLISSEILSTSTGRSLGRGLAVMNSVEAANRAIEELNNTDFGGRSMLVKLDELA